MAFADLDLAGRGGGALAPDAWRQTSERLDRRQDRLGRIMLALLIAAATLIVANRLAAF
jgi:hypothetical protein